MRFKLAIGTLIAAATVAGVFAQSGTVKVVYWDFFGGGDGIRMKQIVADFNKSQSDIQIENSTLAWGEPFYTKIHTSVVAGETPDVMTYHLSHLGAGIKGKDLRPITNEELAAAGLPVSKFLPSLVKASLGYAKSEGGENKLYGVPLDTHTLVMYYNKDILKKAGVLDANGKPTGLTGVDNFTATLRTIKEKAGVQPIATSSAQDPADVWRIFYTLLNQQNGALVKGGKLSTADLATRGKKALDTMIGWTKDGLISKNSDYPSMIGLFTAGRSAFMIVGNWEVPTMVDLKAKGKLFDYGVMAFPKLFDNQKTWADSHMLAIPNNSKKPMSAEKFAAVMKFINYVETKGGVTWAGGGHIPANQDILKSAAYKSLQPNADYSPLASKNVVLEPTLSYFGVGGPVYDLVGNSLTPALVGQVTADQALEKFRTELMGFDKK